jgi:uncharacterized ion transporter superfamily protein YfcC
MDAILLIILIVLFIWTIISHMILSGEIDRIEKKYDHSICNIRSAINEIDDFYLKQNQERGNN